MLSEVAQAKKLVQPHKLRYMDFIKKKANYIRSYIPFMFESLELVVKISHDSLIIALDEIKLLKRENRRKFTEGISLDFVKKKLKTLVVDNERENVRSFLNSHQQPN